MKKSLLIAVLALSALWIQSCKKSSDDTTTTATVLFQAYVNGTVWTPTVLNATLTYNAAAKTKTFAFEADSTGKDQILVSSKQSATALDSTFTAQTYIGDTTSTSANKFVYNTYVNGAYASVGSFKAGSFNISSIDVSKKLVSGTFLFYESKLNYVNGVVVSVTSTAITAGQFNDMPYKFIKQ